MLNSIVILKVLAGNYEACEIIEGNDVFELNSLREELVIVH